MSHATTAVCSTTNCSKDLCRLVVGPVVYDLHKDVSVRNGKRLSKEIASHES